MARKIDRREFISSSLVFAGAAFASSCTMRHVMPVGLTVPRRTFGKTGVKISKLCLGGGSFMSTDGRALLDEALKFGVDCWEIVSFTGKAYSDYFQQRPEMREKIFLTGKVHSTDPAVMQEQLDKALAENGTSFIDFLAIHVVDNVEELTDDVKKWVEKVKKEKKIRFFGFCTHKNMDNSLDGAAELGWIDGIQTVYNYRMQNIKSMEEALQKCHDKGIGIFAIKSMGLCVQQKGELQKLPLNEEKMKSLFAGHGLSFEQAKLKAIWQNPNVTSVCSLMPDLAILRSNAGAAKDERPLDAEITKLLREHADSTGRYFCRRCGACETANTDKIPIFDVMEMLMYARAYGWNDWAAESFAQIPEEVRGKMKSSDYSGAEKICPQNMPIGQLMREACMEFNRE